MRRFVPVQPVGLNPLRFACGEELRQTTRQAKGEGARVEEVRNGEKARGSLAAPSPFACLVVGRSGHEGRRG